MVKLNKITIGMTVLALSALTPVFTHAQELEIGVLGGVTGLKQGETKISDGNNLGLSVMYMQLLNENWKIGLGGEFGFYAISKEELGYKDASMAVDSENDAFEFRYNIGKYTEEIKGNYISIPLKVQYESQAIRNSRFSIYASGGVKYQMYTNSKSKLELEDLKTSGYYKEWDAELHAPQSEGFGSFGNSSIERDYKLKDGFLALAELGVRYSLSKGQSLYLGVYGDYDLSASAEKQKSLISYKTNDVNHLKMNSMLKNEDGKYAMRLFTVGVKLKYSIGI